MERIKIEKRIEILGEFVKKYPIIWLNRNNMFDEWDKLEEMHEQISNETSDNEILKNNYEQLLEKLSIECGFDDAKDFTELKEIKEQFEFCKESFEYISYRKYKKLLPKELDEKMRQLEIGGVFGSELKSIKEKYEIKGSCLSNVVSKYGGIDNFRKVYVDYIVKVYAGKECEKPELGELEKYLISSFDISSNDLINRESGVFLLYKDITDTQNLFVDSLVLEEQINKCLAGLKPRTREVLESYYGINGETSKSAAKIAQEYGISTARVLQIRRAAIARLKEPYNLVFLKDVEKKNDIEVDDLEKFIRNFFEKHDIFYKEDSFELDEESRQQLINLYENAKTKKKANEERKTLKQNKNKENDTLRKKQVQQFKQESIEKLLAKIPLKQIGVSKFPDVIVTEWFEMDTTNISKKTILDINARIKELKLILNRAIERDLVVQEMDYRNEYVKRLNFSVRAQNVIDTKNIITIGQLIELTTQELQECRNLGKKTYYEIVDKIHSLGLYFADEPQTQDKEKSTKFIIECDLNKVLQKVFTVRAGAKTIEDLGLPLRTYNALKRAHMDSLETLLKTPMIKIKSIKGLGEKGYQEILNAVHLIGCRFYDEFENTEEIKLEEVIERLKSKYERLNNRINELEELMKKIAVIMKPQTTVVNRDEFISEMPSAEKIREEYLALQKEKKQIAKRLSEIGVSRD